MGGSSSRRPDGTYRDVARHVRSTALLAASTFDRLALDAVHLDIRDLDGLQAEAIDAVAVGFDATVCIHPSQVAVVREAYRPTDEKLDWARRVLAAAKTERGVFAFEGRWSTRRCCVTRKARCVGQENPSSSDVVTMVIGDRCCQSMRSAGNHARVVHAVSSASREPLHDGRHDIDYRCQLACASSAVGMHASETVPTAGDCRANAGIK